MSLKIEINIYKLDENPMLGMQNIKAIVNIYVLCDKS